LGGRHSGRPIRFPIDHADELHSGLLALCNQRFQRLLLGGIGGQARRPTDYHAIDRRTLHDCQ
jgi:hypothetical protein